MEGVSTPSTRLGDGLCRPLNPIFTRRAFGNCPHPLPPPKGRGNKVEGVSTPSTRLGDGLRRPLNPIFTRRAFGNCPTP